MSDAYIPNAEYLVKKPNNTSPWTFLTRRFYETLVLRLKSNIPWQYPNDLTCTRNIPITKIKLANYAMSLTIVFNLVIVEMILHLCRNNKELCWNIYCCRYDLQNVERVYDLLSKYINCWNLLGIVQSRLKYFWKYWTLSKAFVKLSRGNRKKMNV